MKLAGLGLLSMFIPRFEDEMQLEDVWVKIAANVQLTAEEMAFLRQSAREVQQKVSQVSKLISDNLVSNSSVLAADVHSDGCKVSRNTDQEVANATDAYIEFATVNFDDRYFVDLVTSNTRITIPNGYSGRYMVGFNVIFQASSTGMRYASTFVNNVFTQTNAISMLTGNAGASDSTSLSATGYLDLEGGDYINLSVFHRAGASLNVQYANLWVVKSS